MVNEEKIPVEETGEIEADLIPESETMESLLDEFVPLKQLRRGEIIDGKIMDIKDDGLLVDIGHKSEGYIPVREMKTIETDVKQNFSIGDEIIAYVINVEGKDGITILSVDKARGEQGWRILEKSMESDENVTGKIIGANRGGAVVEAEGVQGFVPLSQLVGPAREFYVPGGEPPKEGFIGATVKFKIIELNRRRNRAIFSERAALQSWKESQKKELIANINEGDIKKGRVSGISSFGAFVDLGGADGLIHISELSWGAVKSAEDVVQVGEEIDVYILKVDTETLKIALSLRRLSPEPWEGVGDRFKIGDIVNGTVTKLANFGAFARIDSGIEGLIHISEISPDVINHPKDVVNEGDELELKIIRVEPERRRLGLSLKQVTHPDLSVKVEEPKSEESKVEEPKSEESKVEEPKSEENQETIKNDENSDINNDDLDKVDDNIRNENDDQNESEKS